MRFQVDNIILYSCKFIAKYRKVVRKWSQRRSLKAVNIKIKFLRNVLSEIRSSICLLVREKLILQFKLWNILHRIYNSKHSNILFIFEKFCVNAHCQCQELAQCIQYIVRDRGVLIEKEKQREEVVTQSMTCTNNITYSLYSHATAMQ